MSKRILSTLLFSLIFIAVGLGPYRPALADESPPSHQFKPGIDDELFASASRWIPEIDDEVLIAFYLPVTESILNDLSDATAQGLTPVIAFQTKGSIEVVGNGAAGYRTQSYVAIDHTDGSRTIIRSERSAAEADENQPNLEQLELYVTPLPEWLSRLQVGDTLVVGGTAQGTATVSGNEADNQATVQWKTVGYDISQQLPVPTPWLGWHFEPGWPSR